MLLTPANGVYFKEPNSQQAWYMREGHKCVLVSREALQKLGLDWGDVELLRWEDINAVPDGPAEDGHLGRVPLPANAVALAWNTPYIHRYDHTYFRGSQHIESFWRLYADGHAVGTFYYKNDSNLGFCGGVTVGVLDATNQIVYSFTPPSGCINGKFGGHENVRNVDWDYHLDPAILPRARSLIARGYETQGTPFIEPGDLVKWLGVAAGIFVGGGARKIA